MTDPKCSICGEPRSLHIPTNSGPLTHPREVRGEGIYVLDRSGYTMGGGLGGDDIDVPPRYRFEPYTQPVAWENAWSPYP